MTKLTPTTVWLVIAGVSIVTYSLRSSFLLTIGHVSLPDRVENVFPFVPIAVLAGLAAPEFLLADGGLVLGLENPRLFAGLIAVVAAWYTESIMATVGIGMTVLWTLMWI